MGPCFGHNLSPKPSKHPGWRDNGRGPTTAISEAEP